MEALGLQEARGEAQALRAVVVAGDEQHGHPEPPHHAVQDVVQEGHGLLGRHGPVVDVPGDHQGLGPGVLQHGHDLVQGVGLVLQEVGVAEGLAQVPVGGVEESHEDIQCGAKGSRGPWPEGRRGASQVPPWAWTDKGGRGQGSVLVLHCAGPSPFRDTMFSREPDQGKRAVPGIPGPPHGAGEGTQWHGGYPGRAGGPAGRGDAGREHPVPGRCGGGDHWLRQGHHPGPAPHGHGPGGGRPQGGDLPGDPGFGPGRGRGGTGHADRGRGGNPAGNLRPPFGRVRREGGRALSRRGGTSGSPTGPAAPTGPDLGLPRSFDKSRF